MNEYFNWPGIAKDCQAFINACHGDAGAMILGSLAAGLVNTIKTKVSYSELSKGAEEFYG